MSYGHDAAVPAPAQSSASFIGAIFDFSFSEFVTLKIIRFIYGLELFLVGVGSLAVGLPMISSYGTSNKIMGVVAIPVIFLIGATLARVFLEAMIVLFRIAENTRETAAQGRAAAQHARTSASGGY